MPGLIHRNAGKFHHFAPFLGLVGDELAEFGRRHRLRNAADLGEPRHQLGVLQRFADRLVEDIDDFRRRALRHRDAVEADGLESRHGFGDRGHVGHASASASAR